MRERTVCYFSVKMRRLWLLTILFCAIKQSSAANTTNAAPVLQAGAIDYAIVNQILPAGTNLHTLLVTDPDNGTLTYSIIRVTYFQNDTGVPVLVSNPPTEVFGKANASIPSQCSLAELFPFPRNLFCMEPTNNSIKTTSTYSIATKADFSLFAVTVFVTDNGSPQKNLTTVVYFRIRENCTDSTREYTNLMTGCAEAREIIRRTGIPTEVGFIFTVPNNTKIARVTVDFSLFNPFKVIGDIVSYRFEYNFGSQRNSVVLNRRMLVNTTLDRKIAMFLWKPIDIIGDKVNVSVTLNVESGRNRLSGGGQGLELFLLNRSRNYCKNSECVGLYDTLSKSMAANGGKPECTRQDQFVVVEKYSKCVVATRNAAPVLQAGANNYAVINKTLPAGTTLHKLLVTDPDKGTLTFSISAVTYFKNGTEAPVSASNLSWALTGTPSSRNISQCSLAESYPFPRNLFCMEPNSNSIKTTLKYNGAIKADFSLFAVAVFAIDSGSPQKNLTTSVYFRIRENCSDSTREYTNLMTGCAEAREIIRRTGTPTDVGFIFTVPNNTKIARITVDFGLLNPFKVISDVVNYRFTYKSGGKGKLEILERRLLVNTTLDRKIAMFLWKPVDIIGDKVNVSVSLSVDSGTRRLSGGGQGIELFLLNRSRNYCENSGCVGLYDILSKSMAARCGQSECRRKDQFVVCEKYSKCIVVAQNAAPVLQAGAIDYVIINKAVPAQSNLHNLLVTDPDKGKLTFSISAVKYFKNGTEAPVSASSLSWALTGTPRYSNLSQCSLAESYPFPRNLFCMEPTSNSIKTTSKYNGTAKADFSLFAVTVFVIDNGSPQKNLTTVVYFRIRENCNDFTGEYTNLMTGCTEAKEIIRRTGTPSEVGFIFNVPNNTKIARITVDFGLLNPFKVISDVVNYRFTYTSGGKGKSEILKRRLLVNTTLDRKIAMFLWKPIDIIGDRANVSVSLNVDGGRSMLSGGRQSIELFLLSRSRNYCENSGCVGLYDVLSKAVAAKGGQPECTRQDQFVVVEKYSKCTVNQPPILSIPNIQLETAPFQGQVIGRLVGTDKEKTKITYGIQWVHSKILGRNATESKGFAGRECAEAAKVAAPLSYICVDPNSGEVKATSEFKYVLRETLTVKVYAIDSGNPRQYSTRVFEINTYDPCKRTKTRYNQLSTSCMGTKNQYVAARKTESALLFSKNGDRVVRIGINRNIVKFPLDIDFTIFTLKQVLSPLNPRKYGRQVSLEYNNTVQDIQNKSDVQLPLVLSFESAVEVELSAVSYSSSSTTMKIPTLDSSGIRLYVHSFKATCGSTECVAAYRSWMDEANKSGLDSCKADPLLVHQYYKICLNPPTFNVHPKNISVPMNSAILVNCTYQNFTAVKFQWIKDGAIFTPPTVFNRNAYQEDSVVSPPNPQGQTFKSFTIQGVVPDLQGYYHCMVKDALNHTVNSTKSLVRFRDVSTSRMVLNINQPFTAALRNRTSLQYKKLSADVTNALQNMLDRNNMHKQRKVVIRDFRPGSVIASVDIYYMNVTEQNRRSLCSQFKHISPSVTGTGLHISSVKTVSYDCCYREQTGEKNIKGVITWNPILADSFDRQICPYEFYDYDLNITVLSKASRFCQPNFQDGAQWQTPNISECGYRTATTLKLEKMSETNITDDNVEQIAGELDSITSSEDEITNRLDVKFTADTIESLVNSNRKLSKIVKDIINTTSNMMDFNYTYVTESQVQYKSSSKVLTSLGKLALQIELLPNATVRTTSKNLALAIKPIKNVGNGIAISAKRDESSGYNKINIEDTPSSQVSLTDAAQILLPELLLRKAAQLDPSSFTRIYSFVFESDRLFLTKKQLEQSLNASSRQTASGLSEKINSRILSASIGKIKVENLTENEEMRGRFRILSKDPGEVKCVYWNVNIEDGFGAWWSNGCRPVGMANSIQKCRCNHLTNFAILLDVTGKGTLQEAATALSIITYIGCAISLICLLITLTTFAVFKKLREKRPPRILMSLCVALILTIIIFLAGIRAKDLKGCQAVAVLIHYFVLASFMWMAVEGFNLYLSFVKVMNTGISRFMLKSSVFAWGTPVIIVTISAAATKLESYGKKNGVDEFVCMITGTAFYVAYLLPILLIVTTNLVVMGFVTKSLRKSSQVSRDNRMTGLTMARIGAACSVLMGTTWIIGLFAVDVLTIPMQVLFCIFNSLQGFFIFTFYCARNKDAKKQWMDTFGSRATEDSKSSSLGFHRYKAAKGSPGANKGLMVSTNLHELEPQNKPSPRSSISVYDSPAEDNIVSLKDVQHHKSKNRGEVKEEKLDSGFREDNDSVNFVSGPGEVDVIVKLGNHDAALTPDDGILSHASEHSRHPSN